MAFMPSHQAKTPKYDVYGANNGEDDLLSEDESSEKNSSGRFSKRLHYSTISSPDDNVPHHSTPVLAVKPPPVHVSTDDVISEALGSGDFCIRQKVKGTRTENSHSSLLEETDVSRRIVKDKASESNSSKGSRSAIYSVFSSITTPANSIRPFGLISSRTGSSSSKRTALGSARSSGSARVQTPASERSRTPGSGRLRTPGAPPASTIVAVVEGRGQARGEVGVAAIDLRCPQLSLVQFSDTHTYTRTLTKLTIFNPLEVIVASTAVPSDFSERAGGGGLVRVIQESMSEASVTAIHRRYFNDTRGLAIVKHLASRECAYIERHISTKYYCLAAVAALMKYVEHIQHVTYVPHSLHVTLSSSENTMCIDYSSCRKLELVRSLQGGWVNSLFGALRHTRTPGGTRLLRASLLQPHADVVTITSRLDALQYLVENPDLFYTLQSILGRFPDIDWLVSMCIQLPKEDTEQRCEQRLNYVIALKNTLELLSPILMALEEVTNPLLLSVKEAVSSEALNELLNLLREVLHEDARLVKGAAAMRTQRCYAIKSNVNGLLDVARKIYSEIIDDITAYVEELGKELKLPLRVGHNAARGFHITIPTKKKSSAPRLPPLLIQVQRGRGCITCTTDHVYQLDQRSRDTLRDILMMSNVIVLEMLVEARGRVGALHALGEAIANLDLVVALAHAASLGAWVRPEFSRALAIREGRHPILDSMTSDPPVPNNTFLSPENCVTIITGPNMSGKSTYLRQIALIQILAQIGSFVPAEFASVRIVRQLFTHLGSEDSPENNASTFQVQMSDVAHMLGGADQNSLVLLDELGSGTSIEEGGSLAWAVMETLIHAKVPTVLATHALFLTKLAHLYPSVSNYHFDSTNSSNGRLQLTHIMHEGVTQATHYGITLASVTAIPRSVVNRAMDLALTMTPATQITEENESDNVQYRAVYHLAHQLIALTEATNISSGISPDETTNEEKDTPQTQLARSSYLNSVLLTSDFSSLQAKLNSGTENDSINLAGNSNDDCTGEIRLRLQSLIQKFMEQVQIPPKEST